MPHDAEDNFSNPLPCANQPWLFYSGRWDYQQQAKALCETCLLRPQCLDRALRIGGFDRSVDGVEGGLDPQERGYYLKLFGRPKNGRVQELPERFRTKAPKRGAVA